MPKKPHPADMALLAKIAEATHFNVHLRKGPHDAINREARTLMEAIAIRDELGKTPSGKQAMIYAVTPDRQSVFVPADIISEATKDAADIAAGLSGTEIAKLTAIITGGGYKRANSKAAAEARFIKVATEAGIANAADIVRGPYDMVEHVIREKLAGKPLTIAEVKNEPADSLYVDGKSPAIRAFEAGHKADLGAKSTGKRAATLDAAQRGELPPAPDFSAPTHARFRKKLAEIVALAEAGDVAALKAVPINPYSSSPKALARYRDQVVIALEALSLL